MERLIRLYDTLDSVVFELRMRLAGHAGQSLRSFMLLAAVLLSASVSPLFRQLVIATLASFLLAELLAAAVPIRQRLALP